ncbi:MAG: RNA-binding protein [Nanoarchaeota archaeon]|nr:RNA-binding protein [Nanoarchaeota archaeon]|tara:strand:+ start:1935 stop:2612 length:678 start_codon:yes stop_codon:yes gene_type:complete
MAKLLVKNKDLVVPGEVLVEGMEYLPAGNVFRDKDKIIANTIGLVSIDNRLIKLIPLTGFYTPKKDDVVIGKVENITFSSWFMDIGCSNLAMLSLKEATSEYIERGADLGKFYNFNDVVVARVINVTKDGSIDLSMKGPGLMKLSNGRVVNVTPSKVPRVIGKQGSMISMIKEKTGCKMTVGQNGKIWIQGPDPKNEKKAVDAIKLIEEYSATDGLTEKVEVLLK